MDMKTLDGFMESVRIDKRISGLYHNGEYGHKNNGVRLRGIAVKPQGSLTAPNIYMEKYYEDFLKGRSFAGIMGEIKYSAPQGFSWAGSHLLRAAVVCGWKSDIGYGYRYAGGGLRCQLGMPLPACMREYTKDGTRPSPSAFWFWT